MMRRNRFIQALATMLLAGAVLLPQIVFAQDSSKATSDSKIRNIDGVAAVVNTGYVTRKEIDDRIASIQKQAPAGGKKLPEGDELRKQVLENLILEKIQIQEAEQTGLAVNEKELNKIIEDIATRNKLTFSEFRDTVTKSGMSFQRYRELLADQAGQAFAGLAGECVLQAHEHVVEAHFCTPALLHFEACRYPVGGMLEQGHVAMQGDALVRGCRLISIKAVFTQQRIYLMPML